MGTLELQAHISPRCQVAPATADQCFKAHSRLNSLHLPLLLLLRFVLSCESRCVFPGAGMQGRRSLVELAPLASQGMGDCCAAATTELLEDCCCFAAYGAGLRDW